MDPAHRLSRRGGTFTGKRVFRDGTRTLEGHDIDPRPHEVVIAHLPTEKAVFEAGLRTIPPTDDLKAALAVPAP